jgi:hypothetical protein
MSQLRLRRSIACLLYVAAASVPIAAEPGAAADVVVRVYGAPAEQSLREAAMRQASGILAATGLAVAWHDCTGDADRRHCDHLRGARTLIVRIAPEFVPVASAARGALETRSPGDAPGLILGFAVVEQSSGGVMATVFLDRVRSVARRAGIAAGVLLGRAMAHEVGHLLLSSNAHSSSGLMRESWTDAELTHHHPGDWLFTAADEARLHHNLRPSLAATFVRR